MGKDTCKLCQMFEQMIEHRDRYWNTAYGDEKTRLKEGDEFRAAMKALREAYNTTKHTCFQLD